MSERRDQHQRRTAKQAIEPAQEGSSQQRSEARIARLARAAGNEEIQRRISEGNASRDLMLGHLTDRLKVMHELQRQEIDLSHRGSQFQYWRKVADAHKPEYTSPEPTRWNEAARLYERAAEHLCQGELARGRDILEQAMAEEQRARENLTALVHTETVDSESPELTLPGSTEVAGVCDLPDEVRLAREIYYVTTEGPDIPNRRRPADPWWTLDEEEEEEEPGDGGS